MIDLAQLTAKQSAKLSDFDLSLAAYKLICEPFDGVKMEKAQDHVRKLPPLIRPLYTVLILQSEVENGGFNQYFWNSSGKLASKTFDDLVYVGAKQHASTPNLNLLMTSSTSCLNLISFVLTTSGRICKTFRIIFKRGKQNFLRRAE